MNVLQHVFDANGNVKTLGKVLGNGGEGTVYPLADRPEIIVKCYHQEKLDRYGKTLQQKVEAMCGLKENFKATAASWPLISVFDESKQWIGYAMYRAHGVPMAKLAHPMTYEKFFPNLNRVDIVSYLISMLEAISTLHKAGVLIGDYNLNNIMCTPGTNQITLIDCDSFQITQNGRFYPCLVGSPDMTAPEHHNAQFSEVRRTEASEAFSIAILLFKCLMLGRHPYDIVDGADPVTNLRAGKFAYGRGNKGIPKGYWYNIWSHMPFQLKSKFVLAFTEGTSKPHKRPSILEWQEELHLYRKEMQKGWHEEAIRPAAPKSQKYNGNQNLELMID